MTTTTPQILVVDDNPDNRDLLSRQLGRRGYTIVVAENGREALAIMRVQPFDLVLLDIMMPVMNGYEVLQQLKDDPALRHIPVIVISAADDLSSMVRGIQLGAEDYLSKPFNSVLLKARIEASLEKKHFRDQEQIYVQALAAEQQKSERLLLSILPKVIAEKLKDQQQIIADYFAQATVLFADVVDFSRFSARISPDTLVRWLNDLFSTFDQLAADHGLEKIKTIGDSYMVAGGIPLPHPDHIQAVAAMALDMQRVAAEFKLPQGEPLAIRIGIHTGPVVAGVIGTSKFSYDLWGDTVNIASRMESQGTPGTIQITEAMYAGLADSPGFAFSPATEIDIKGKGPMKTYFLQSGAES